jgi:hypothetical protein
MGNKKTHPVRTAPGKQRRRLARPITSLGSIRTETGATSRRSRSEGSALVMRTPAAPPGPEQGSTGRRVSCFPVSVRRSGRRQHVHRHARVLSGAPHHRSLARTAQAARRDPLDAHRLRFHLCAHLRYGGHRRAARGRLPRQRGAGAGDDAAGDDRRDRLPHPPRQPCHPAGARGRRHALRQLPDLLRGGAAQRRALREGPRRSSASCAPRFR